MAIGTCLALFAMLALEATGSPAGDKGSARRLWPSQFAAQRPGTVAAPRPRPETAVAAVSITRIEPDPTQFVGVTLWSVTPAPAGAAASEFAAQRIEPGRELAEGERVRLSFESTRRGYLYVIDREEYADGGLGTPVLLFPTLRLRGGDNRVGSGRVVELPDQLDSPPFFSLRRSRGNHVGERLTVLVSAEPLSDVQPGPGPQTLDARRVVEWERRATAASERFDVPASGAAGYSQAEREAGGPQARLLGHADPLPQTLYRVETQPSPGSLVLVHVRLPIGR